MCVGDKNITSWGNMKIIGKHICNLSIAFFALKHYQIQFKID